MKQALHIFRKDVRHYWREILVSILLLIAYTWYQARDLAHPGGLAFGAVGLRGFLGVDFLSNLVGLLLPISWVFLIVRAIQDEALVGDRQFWTTRPYVWKSLLSAKLLFIVAFLNLPLLLAEVFLLMSAGFVPWRYIVGLFFMQLLILLFLVLPVMTVAVLTSTLVQFLLGTLVVFLYLVGIVSLSELIPASSLSYPSDSLPPVLILGACFAIILLQYARRATAKSRWLVAGLGAALLLLLVATPYQFLFEKTFPPLSSNQQPPVTFELQPMGAAAKEEEALDGDEMEIQFPLNTTGAPPASLVQVQGMLVTIDGPDGVHWSSGWRTAYLYFFPNQRRAELRFNLKNKIYQRLKMLPVNTRISLAFTTYRQYDAGEFVVPGEEFTMPSVGVCTSRPGYTSEVECRAPMRQPSSLLIETDMSASTCPLTANDKPIPAPGTMAHQWYSGTDSQPADFGLNPVHAFDVSLAPDNGYDATRRFLSGICPGTPLTISRTAPMQNGRFDLNFNNIRLFDYRRSLGTITLNRRR